MTCKENVHNYFVRVFMSTLYLLRINIQKSNILNVFITSCHGRALGGDSRVPLFIKFESKMVYHNLFEKLLFFNAY